MKTDESLIGAWLGLACVALALLPWIPMDIWLKRHGHEYITVEVRELLKKGGFKALGFVAFVGAVLFMGGYHFFYQRGLQ